MLSSIARPHLLGRIQAATRRYPITIVLGARQTGKTVLCRGLASSPDHYFDLERSIDAVRLSDNALSVLGGLSGWVVVDEAQELPQLFKTLRVLADRPELPARFVVTGSVSPTLLESVGESLAGRAAFLEIGGFDLREAGTADWKLLWLRGGHPPSFLAPGDDLADDWRENYLSAMVGRDLRIWSHANLPPAQIRKLLDLVADSTGQAWNHTAAAKHLRISYKTVQSYVETLKAGYLVRELPPFEANVRKRIRRSPTLLIRDSGIHHTLLRVSEEAHLESHPRRGQSWEAFGTDQVIRMAGFKEGHCFRYSVQGGAEIDLVADLPGRRLGFEFKAGDSPRLTDSMKAGRDDLGLEALYVVFPGDARFRMDERIEAVGIERLPDLCNEVGG